MNSPATRDTSPIFIQAMWRTGSTYVWKKFRDQRQYRAYYEPLHEGLLLPREQVQELSSPERRTELRHVPVDEFYFAEYPFEPAGGVKYLQKPLSYQRYCLRPDEEDSDLYSYIANLIEYAREKGQRPVFQFNRALLRSGWLARNFGGLQILVLRNPRDVWKSFETFAGYPFETRICAIRGQNRDKYPLTQLPHWVDFPRSLAETFEEECRTYTPFAGEHRALLYAAFFDFYLLCMLHCAQYADCILDLDGISQDAALHSAACNGLADLGIDVSLDDCRLPVYPRHDSDEEWRVYEQFSIGLLKTRLDVDFLLQGNCFQKMVPLLGSYFRQLLGNFTPDAGGGTCGGVDPIERKERHLLAIQLFSRGDQRIGAHLLGDLLAGGETGELWNDWATAQKSCGRPHLAELGFRQALQAEVPEREAGANLGVLLSELGKYREALPFLQEAELRSGENIRPVLSHLVNVARRELGFGALDGSSANHGRGLTIFLTGLSAAGKSSIAQALVAELQRRGKQGVVLLDGDEVRQHLSRDLGFSKEHRDMNVLRIGFVAAQVTRCGGMAVCAAIAPYDETRKKVRQLVEAEGQFCLVYVRTPIDVCAARDPKGLYAKARNRELPVFTGVSDPYEPPQDAELSIDTTAISCEEAAQTILDKVFQVSALQSVATIF